jgi:hypothetical protein
MERLKGQVEPTAPYEPRQGMVHAFAGPWVMNNLLFKIIEGLWYEF